MHSPQNFTASLCSDAEELTNRHSCRMEDGYPRVHIEPGAHASDGVADVLTVWCADCGGFVRRYQLQKLVVFDGGLVMLVNLPAVPMFDNVWGEA